MKPKIVFWNVDTQKDFMNKDGALYIKGAETIKPNLQKLTDYANENYIPIINTRDFHDEDDVEFSDNPNFVDTFPKHCVKYSKGAEFIDETRPSTLDVNIIPNSTRSPEIDLDRKDIIIDKNHFDVFLGNFNTEELVEFINPDIAVVYGVATNVCVDFAVKGLIRMGIDVFVIKDAIKELPNACVDAFYRNWYRLGVTLIDTDQQLNIKV